MKYIFSNYISRSIQNLQSSFVKLAMNKTLVNDSHEKQDYVKKLLINRLVSNRENSMQISLKALTLNKNLILKESNQKLAFTVNKIRDLRLQFARIAYHKLKIKTFISSGITIGKNLEKKTAVFKTLSRNIHNLEELAYVKLISNKKDLEKNENFENLNNSMKKLSKNNMIFKLLDMQTLSIDLVYKK